MLLDISDSLKLRLLRSEDASELFLLTDRNREFLMQWLPWLNRTKVEADTLGFIEMTKKQFGNKQGAQFGIWHDDKLAGVVGHHKIDWANKSTSLGYWLGEEFGGLGIMTRACKELVDYSFRDLALNRVSIAAATENGKSRAIPERLGFKLEGVLRQEEWLYDHYVDHCVYSVLSGEWSF
jgi:ribosomal-protein-serine acetyltransferase